ncbi:OLC1v1031886C1 [Oldenlandia corymbosa var. corymbosa]|uniref:OLC1v1031886C1 n=1 Tax=Oldenlandia corymbosa var. corymbosa TaxID=529605 RepID=A0AAV1CME4_OLDCO|nr:OLC1v1031886C1 [Oldenlandia corymbosa var. corymbosa]
MTDRDGSVGSEDFIRIVPTPDNVVSTVFLDCYVDLTAIASKAGGLARYNPKRIDAVIIRIKTLPNTKVFVYAFGMMICVGAKDEEHSNLVAQKYALFIQKLGFSAKFKDFKIQRKPGLGRVNVPIMFGDLALAYEASSKCKPNPTQASSGQKSIVRSKGWREVPIPLLQSAVEPRLEEDNAVLLSTLCMKLAKDEESNRKVVSADAPVTSPAGVVEDTIDSADASAAVPIGGADIATYHADACVRRPGAGVKRLRVAY